MLLESRISLAKTTKNFNTNEVIILSKNKWRNNNIKWYISQNFWQIGLLYNRTNGINLKQYIIKRHNEYTH